jgi:hypothetical protein
MQGFYRDIDLVPSLSIVFHCSSDLEKQNQFMSNVVLKDFYHHDIDPVLSLSIAFHCASDLENQNQFLSNVVLRDFYHHDIDPVSSLSIVFHCPSDLEVQSHSTSTFLSHLLNTFYISVKEHNRYSSVNDKTLDKFQFQITQNTNACMKFRQEMNIKTNLQMTSYMP